MRRPRAVVLQASGRLAAGVLATAFLLMGPGATAAWAHDSLAGSTPAAEAALPTPPAEVTLEFAEPPQSLGTQVRVTGPHGTAASEGAPEVRGSTVTQPLAAGLPAGSYTVDWRVTSADGHPISGTFSFTATGGAPAAAASTGDVPTAAAGPTGTSFPWVWIAVVVLAAVGGTVVVRQLRGPA